MASRRRHRRCAVSLMSRRTSARRIDIHIIKNRQALRTSFRRQIWRSYRLGTRLRNAIGALGPTRIRRSDFRGQFETVSQGRVRFRDGRSAAQVSFCRDHEGKLIGRVRTNSVPGSLRRTCRLPCSCCAKASTRRMPSRLPDLISNVEGSPTPSSLTEIAMLS